MANPGAASAGFGHLADLHQFSLTATLREERAKGPSPTLGADGIRQGLSQAITGERMIQGRDFSVRG